MLKLSPTITITPTVQGCRDFFISFIRKLADKFDRQGKPIELLEWCKLFEDPNYKIIKRTKLWWGGLVSTVWLGLDHQHSFHADARPLIFESMVFTHNGGDMGCQERYSTCEQAEQRHNAIVKEYSSLYHALRSVIVSFQHNSIIKNVIKFRGK